jgi:hypothetical protein
MQDRMERLERANRVLVLVIVALVAFVAGSLCGPRRGELNVLPRAQARPGIEILGKKDPRPARVFTTSQSGSALFEYVLTADGKYVQSVWH